MAIELVCRCDKCNAVIETSHNIYDKLLPESPKGFAILGNIHDVDPKHDKCVGGGFVGNNFDGENTLTRISYYCKDCLIKVLHLDNEFKKVGVR